MTPKTRCEILVCSKKNVFILAGIVIIIGLCCYANRFAHAVSTNHVMVIQSKMRSIEDLQDGCHVATGPQRDQLPSCSLELFRDYYAVRSSFPECGRWVGKEGYGYAEKYVLDFCNLEPFNWQECSLEKNIRHILLTGDSTGWRLFMSLLNVTIAMGGDCEFIKSEGESSLTPNITYWSMGDDRIMKAFRVGQRGCGWCRGQAFMCRLRTHKGIHSIKIEFIELFRLHDESLTLPIRDTKDLTVQSASTFYEYIFQTYLPRLGFPDTMIMSIPMNHEKKHQNITTDFKELLALIEEHKPREMQTYWIPTASEFDSKRWKRKYINLTFNGLLATDGIYKGNVDLYGILEPFLLDPHSNMYGFVNLINMSESKVEWCEDGVHYNYVWYSHVIWTLLSIICL